jgi:hypothetical protein
LSGRIISTALLKKDFPDVKGRPGNQFE